VRPSVAVQSESRIQGHLAYHLTRDLRRQYAQRFRIVRSESGTEALKVLRELRLAEEEVAVLLADHRMPGMTGVEFLEQSLELYADAKRVLLTAYADTEAAIHAINAVGLDYYLLKPWSPTEQKLYAVLDDLIEEWLAGYKPPFEGVRLIGHRWSSRSYEIKDLLARNQIPFQWLDVDTSDEARELLAASQIAPSPDRMPVVATFLFESLSADQLRRLAELGTVLEFNDGETVFVEGQPAEFLWVLLSGEMDLERNVGGQRIAITTASRPGTYGGGLQGFTGTGPPIGYRATAKARQRTRFFRLPSSELARLVGEWSPLSKHFLDGYLQRLEGMEATVRERERLISLGRLAAGLAHEVNNPAAAALRDATDLRGGLQQLRDVVGWMAETGISADQLAHLVRLQRDAVAASQPAVRSAIDLANAEDAVGTWLDEHNVDNAWTIASTFTAAGLDEVWLDGVADTVEHTALGACLNWIAATLSSRHRAEPGVDEPD